MFINRKEAIHNATERLKAEMQNSQAVKQIENQVGYKIDIDTLTGIKSKVTEQKFYEAKPSDYMPVVVGENAYADDQLTYITRSLADNFEAGLIEPGSNDGKLSQADANIEGVRVPNRFWANQINYNLIELAQASRSGNWSLVEAKERARYTNWWTGVQRVAFLGLDSAANFKGLLTQTTVNINTTTITKNIKDMNPTEFQDFIGNFLSDYVANTNSTAMPDTFIIPTDDYTGLASAVDETFNLKTRLERIQEAAVAVTGNADFKVLPLNYSQLENNDLSVNRYVLYRRVDETSLRMDIPVDYTTTVTDTINGFNYTSVAYGQFSAVEAYRPLEMLYFDHAA